MALILPIVYLNYCFKLKQNSADHTKAVKILYCISSGLCCCCILFSIIGRCMKDKDKFRIMSFTIKTISLLLHSIWLGIMIIIGIPFILVACIILLVLVIPCGIVYLCRCCGYEEVIDNSRQEIVNNVLYYEIKHDTYAAMMLGNHRNSPDEFQPQDNTAPEHVAIHVFDDNSEDVPLRPNTIRLQHLVK